MAHVIGSEVAAEAGEDALTRAQWQLCESQRIAHIGSWEWDLRADTIQWSDELFRLFGLSPSQPLDYAAYLERLHPAEREHVRGVVEQALQTRGSYEIEHRIVLPSGAERWVLGRGEVVTDGGGAPIRMRGVVQDLTERRTRNHSEEALRESEARAVQRADALSQLTAELQRTNKELDAFAYAASHDLRAPLRGIANLAQWIEEDLQDSLRDDTREMLALLHSRMHRMETLIDGILQYSRAGRDHQPLEIVDTQALAEEVVELLAVEPSRVRIDAPLPSLVAQRVPLQQIVQNLVANALKHGGGGVHIRIAADDTGAGWRFSVSDDGPGIPPEFHDRIWGIFQTLEPRDKVEGAGIGLSLVKKLVEAMGGRVGVSSAPGAGATFTFDLPKRNQPAEDA